MFAGDFWKQFYRQGGQHDTGGKVLDHAAGLMAWRPDGSQQTAHQGDHGGNGHQEEGGGGHDTGRLVKNTPAIVMVPGTGVEPVRLAAPDFKSGMSTNSITRAGLPGVTGRQHAIIKEEASPRWGRTGRQAQPTRRLRTAAASSRNTGSVCSMLMQASVIDTPRFSSPLPRS